jgi:hypothetical protein
MSQTTVSAGGQSAGVAGQIADSLDGPDIVSGFNMEATAQMPWGIGVRVQPGSTGDGFLLPTGNTGGPQLDIAGVNVFSHDHHRAANADSAGNFGGDLGSTGLNPKAVLQVLRDGRIWVPVETNVVPGDRAFCRGVATGTFGQGIWSGTGLVAAGAAPSFHIDCSKQGVFRTATFTAADGSTKVAVLETDFTNKP